MNKILKIIEKRELYTHIILFKVYINTQGRTDEFYRGHLEKDIEELMGDQFDSDDYYTATQYLFSEGLTEEGGFPITVSGRAYIENWANEFESLSESDREVLKKELQPKLFDFFGMAEKANTALSLIKSLVETFQIVNN